MRRKAFALMESDANSLMARMNWSSKKTIPVRKGSAMVSGRTGAVLTGRDASSAIRRWIGKISPAF